MANNAILYIASTDNVPNLIKEPHVLMSNYYIPALWLACFDETKIRTYHFEEDDDWKAEFCCIKLKEAIEKIKTREQALKNLFSNITPYIDIWYMFLNKACERGNYLTIEISEILDM